MAPLIVLDASVLIGFLDSADVHHARARELLLAHADELLAASAVTLAEVLVGPVRLGRSTQVLEALRELEIASVPLADAELDLAELRASTGLRMPDCCVLLAARTLGGPVATFDADLHDAAAQIGVPTAP